MIFSSIPLGELIFTFVGYFNLNGKSFTKIHFSVCLEAEAARSSRVSQAHADGSEAITSKEGFGTSIKDMPTAAWLLLKNPTYMCITFNGVGLGLLSSGFATFLAKFIQNQFGQTAGFAAMIAGTCCYNL